MSTGCYRSSRYSRHRPHRPCRRFRFVYSQRSKVRSGHIVPAEVSPPLIRSQLCECHIPSNRLGDLILGETPMPHSWNLSFARCSEVFVRYPLPTSKTSKLFTALLKETPASSEPIPFYKEKNLSHLHQIHQKLKTIRQNGPLFSPQRCYGMFSHLPYWKLCLDRPLSLGERDVQETQGNNRQLLTTEQHRQRRATRKEAGAHPT